MSQPRRYNFSARIVHIPGGDKEAALHVHHEENGLFVYYADYAALRAEYVRLLEGRESVLNIGRDVWLDNKGVQP